MAAGIIGVHRQEEEILSVMPLLCAQNLGGQRGEAVACAEPVFCSDSLDGVFDGVVDGLLATLFPLLNFRILDRLTFMHLLSCLTQSVRFSMGPGWIPGTPTIPGGGADFFG